MEQPVWDVAQLYSLWRESAQLDVVFQPLVHIPSGHAFGFEALSRPSFHHSPLSISLLLESASASAQLSDFDQFALPAILAAAGRLSFPSSSRLFINVSPITLLNPEWILDIIRTSVVRPSQVVLEVSEREPLSDSMDFNRLLAPYRQAGMAIALDDFGAGYSGLNRLASLDPEFAKIDLNLVRDIDKNPVKHALVEATVHFSGRSGRLQLLAEGIETAAELAALHELGIELGQGYLLGRPAAHLTVVSHNVPLDHVSRRRPNDTERLQAFLTVSHRLIDGLGSGEGIAPHIVHLASRLLTADIVALFSPGEHALELAYSIPELAPSHRTLPLNPQYPGYQAMFGRQTVVFQTSQEAVHARIIQELGLESVMLVPVMDRHQSQALLCVGYRLPYQIRPQDMAIAEGLARLMALGTQASSAHPDVAMGEPLFEAISSLVASEDLDSLLAKVMEAALSVSGGHLGYVGILTPDTLHAVTADKESFEMSRAALFSGTTDEGRGPVGQVLQHGRSVVMQDITQEPSLAPWRDEMLADGIQAALGIPLLSSGQVLGLLKVYHSRKQGFEAMRIRRLEALASLATTILEKWRDEHATQRRLLDEKTAQLGRLIPLLQAAPTGRIGYRAVAESLRVLVDGSTVGLLSLEDGALRPIDDTLALPDAYQAVIHDTAQAAIQRQSVTFSPEIAPGKTLMVLPLCIGGSVVGVIWVICPLEHNHSLVWNELLLPHLQLLSLAAGSAILLERSGLL